MRVPQISYFLLAVGWLFVSHLDITHSTDEFYLYLQKRQALPPTGPPPTGSDRPSVPTTLTSAATTPTSAATTPTSAATTPISAASASPSATDSSSTNSPTATSSGLPISSTTTSELVSSTTTAAITSTTPRTKPGTCPTIAYCFSFGSGCTSDFQCPGAQRCCATGSRRCCFAVRG